MISEGKIQPVLQLWIPVFQWEFKGRWGVSDDFSMSGCIPTMEPVARLCPLFLRTPPGGESTAFREGVNQSLLPFVCGGQGGHQPACSTCGQRGTREPCVIYSLQICLPAGSQVAHSAHLPLDFNCTPTLPREVMRVLSQTEQMLFCLMGHIVCHSMEMSWAPFLLSGQDLLSLSLISASPWQSWGKACSGKCIQRYEYPATHWCHVQSDS